MLKQLLEKVLAEFPPIERKGNDPILFPRKYLDMGRCPTEVEAVALLSAMMAYGSVTQFTKKIEAIMVACDWHFLELITSKPNKDFPWVGYRMSTAEEIATFSYAIGRVIKKFGSLKEVFFEGYKKDSEIKSGLCSLRNAVYEASKDILGTEPPHGIRHLLPDPAAGGCCKRWCMFLRWMVRKNDGMDTGLWSEIPASKLLIPLDVHISQISRNLGLTTRKADDWKTAVEVSESLKKCCPDDPIKYDFALCHLGIAGKCTHGKDKEICKKCILSPVCVFGKKHE